MIRDELIPDNVEDLTDGGWSDVILSPTQIYQEQEEFLALAERFKTLFNRLIVPIRLGILALYSANKISIFNKGIERIIEGFLK